MTPEPASVLRPGRDVTLVSCARTVHVCLRAAAALADLGIRAEVVALGADPPPDVAAVLASVHRTGRLVVVLEAGGPCGNGTELAAAAAENAFTALRSPVRRLVAAGGQAPSPAAVVAAARQLVAPPPAWLA